MSVYKFSPTERAAIYTTHDEKCYLCNTPLNLKTMEVDHIIPEYLLEKPKELRVVFDNFGLPADFDINSFANWMPACSSCNGKKKDVVLEPAPIIQVCLQRAIQKASSAQLLADITISDRKIANALNALERAQDDGKLDDETLQTLNKFILQHRQPALKGQPVRVTQLYEILSEQDGLQIIRGPYGVGGRAISKDYHSFSSCTNCGSAAAWNGVRCVICGEINDV